MTTNSYLTFISHIRSKYRPKKSIAILNGVSQSLRWWQFVEYIFLNICNVENKMNLVHAAIVFGKLSYIAIIYITQLIPTYFEKMPH